MFKKKDFKPFESKVWLSSPTMHGEELQYMEEAYQTNWMSTVGKNINVIEEEIPKKAGVQYGVALASGTSALHLAVKLAGERLYGRQAVGKRTLYGHQVFCSDMTFAATVNPIVYEDGTPIFIDTEYDTWNMDPKALEKAFELYPDVKLIVIAHLYGTPSKMDEILKIAKKHDALVIEDAAESFGSTYKGIPTGSFGDYNCISFNGNKIITGSSGGMFLTNSKEDADKVRKWSTQSREAAPWYQHEELGYNYRMSNVIAGVVRGQLPYLETHIQQKKDIYYRYKDGLKDLPITMNPIPDTCQANYWLSCMLIDASQTSIVNPSEILDAIASINAEGRPIWKPMHMQPIYKDCKFVRFINDVGQDIFTRGLCLPSDNKMTIEQQDKIIEVIKACFE